MNLSLGELHITYIGNQWRAIYDNGKCGHISFGNTLIELLENFNRGFQQSVKGGMDFCSHHIVYGATHNDKQTDVLPTSTHQ